MHSTQRTKGEVGEYIRHDPVLKDEVLLLATFEGGTFGG